MSFGRSLDARRGSTNFIKEPMFKPFFIYCFTIVFVKEADAVNINNHCVIIGYVYKYKKSSNEITKTLHQRK